MTTNTQNMTTAALETACDKLITGIDSLLRIKTAPAAQELLKLAREYVETAVHYIRQGDMTAAGRRMTAAKTYLGMVA